ncbi:MAG TPA: class I SAM-dependent methyltransferase [Solirubrobacteraceae bacterium]
MSDYHEALWEGVPEGLQPPYLSERLAFVLAHVSPAARVLDVGCGEGRFTEAFADRCAQVVGIDVAEEPLRRARARRPDLDLRRVEPAGSWPLADASFDVLWAGEVIEHVADTSAWFSEARRVLRSGGALVLSTPAHEPLTRAALALNARAFEAHFNPRSDHLRFYTRRALLELLADFGFQAPQTRAIGRLPGARRVLLASARRARF